MKSISFSLRESVAPEARESVIEKIRKVPGVLGAALIKPDSRNSVVARMATAYVADNMDPALVRASIESLDQVEGASVPSERYLIQ